MANISFKKINNIFIWILVIVAILYSCLVLNYKTYNLRLTKGSFLWDMADHGFTGVKIYESLKSLNPVSLLIETNQQVIWPFVNSYLLAFIYIIGGPTFDAATLLSMISYFFVILLLFIVGKQVSNSNIGGILAAFLGLTSPLYMVFSSLVMLEIFGSLFILLTFYFYFKYLNNDSYSALMWAGIFMTITFFTKYNYGIILMGSLVLSEFIMNASARNKIISYIKSRINAGILKKKWNIFVIFYLLLMVAVFVAKYPRFIGSIKNLLWVFSFIVFVRILYLKKKNKYIMAVINNNIKLNILFKTTFLPVIIWLLVPYPNRFDSILRFSINRSSELNLSGINNLLYYIRIIDKEYICCNVVFISLIILLICSFLLFKYSGKEMKYLQIFLIIHFLISTAHPYKINRFIFTMLPALWLITSVCLILIINKIKVKNIRTIVHITIILLIAGTMVSNNGLYAYLNREYPFYFAKNRVLSIGDNIVNKTINCRTVRIMGTFCELSPGLLSWLFYSVYIPLKVSSENALKVSTL